MSFSKAKRFDYKEPDFQVSPADFNLSLPLIKPAHQFSKSRRIYQPRQYCKCRKITVAPLTDNNLTYTKNSANSSVSNGLCDSSTPRRRRFSQLNIYKIKEKIISLNEKDIFCNCVEAKRNSNTPIKSVKSIKSLIDKFENGQRDPIFFTSEEYIDDDYYSYTSSNELEEANTTEQMDQNFSEIFNFDKLTLKNTNDPIQRNVLDVQVKTDLPTNNRQLSEEHNLSTGSSNECFDMIKLIISQAIDDLRKEYETKHAVTSNAIDTLLNFIYNMKLTLEDAKEELRRKCEDVSNDLFVRIVEYLNQFDTCQIFDDDVTIREISSDDVNRHHVFSDHLQSAQMELNLLNKDKMNISIKCEDTYEKLRMQTSNIDFLQKEIEEIKQSL
ncbi:unnamed protein product [Phyllotreta striolata]|uniref:Uncharacterized protein n=1 Tax=Phyllotreta striolata TaxID=444603 RepID=A0A9N9TJ44_PHYSR|nr:unnamed protein product [Phyllotreta striolata]